MANVVIRKGQMFPGSGGSGPVDAFDVTYTPTGSTIQMDVGTVLDEFINNTIPYVSSTDIVTDKFEGHEAIGIGDEDYFLMAYYSEEDDSVHTQRVMTKDLHLNSEYVEYVAGEDFDPVTVHDALYAIDGYMASDDIITDKFSTVDEIDDDDYILVETASGDLNKIRKADLITGGGGTPSRDVTWAQYQALTQEEKMSDTDWYVTDRTVPSLGGGIKAKVYEKSVSADGIVVNGEYTDRTNYFYFTSDIGYPIGAVPLCDGTEYRFQGNCKMQMQAFEPDPVTGAARWFFFAQYAGTSSSNHNYIDAQKLTASAMKFIVYYVESVEED